MSRKQILTCFPAFVSTVTTGEQMTSTQLFVKSVLIQSDPLNTDFIYVGDSTIQNIAISPGRSLEIHGDNLDNGTGAMLDISTIYIKANVVGEGCTYSVLKGV